MGKIDFMRFIYNLKYMGIGMLGVVMIVAIIMGATYLISYVSNRLQGKSESNPTED